MVGFDFIHPDGRMITHREALRLCTYPDEFLGHNAVEAVDAVIPVISTYLSGLAKKAIQRAAPIKKEFKVDSEMIEGSGGVFDVHVDGKQIWNKQEVDRFPEHNEILDQIMAK